MPDRIKITNEDGSWEYRDYVVIQPLSSDHQCYVDTPEGRIEPVSLVFHSIWYQGMWRTTLITVTGPAVRDDGTHKDQITYPLDDPHGTGPFGTDTPPWLQRLALKRAARIPAPPNKEGT